MQEEQQPGQPLADEQEAGKEDEQEEGAMAEEPGQEESEEESEEEPARLQAEQEDDSPVQEVPSAADDKTRILRQILKNIRKDINNALALLDGKESFSRRLSESKGLLQKAAQVGDIAKEGANTIMEGVFDGQNMVGPDGKKYSVAANYASKSKLIEGDLLKLTILPDGAFVYKQIGLQRRAHLKGLLIKDKDSGEYRVLSNGKTYRVLPASVSYFKGESGDEAVILVPESEGSSWAAVENIIRKTGDSQQAL